MGSAFAEQVKWEFGYENGKVRSPLHAKLHDAKVDLPAAGVVIAMKGLEGWQRAVQLRYLQEWFEGQYKYHIAAENREAFDIGKKLIDEAINAIKADPKTNRQLLSEGDAADAVRSAYEDTKKFVERQAKSVKAINTAELYNNQFRREDGVLVQLPCLGRELSEAVLSFNEIDSEIKAECVETLVNAKRQQQPGMPDEEVTTYRAVLEAAIDTRQENSQPYKYYKHEVDQLRMQGDLRKEFIDLHSSFSVPLHKMTTQSGLDRSAIKAALTAAIRAALVEAEIDEGRINHVLDVFARDYSPLDNEWMYGYWAGYTVKNGGNLWLKGDDNASGAGQFLMQIGLTAFALVALIGFDIGYVGYARPWKYYAFMMGLIGVGPLTNGSLHTSIASVLALHAVLHGVKLTKMPEIYTRNLMQGISVGSAKQPLLMGVGKAGWSVWNAGPEDMKSPIQHIFAEA